MEFRKLRPTQQVMENMAHFMEESLAEASLSVQMSVYELYLQQHRHAS